MAQFKPLTEVEAANLAPAGEYTARVIEAEETERRATGAPMFKVKLDVFGEGRSWHVYDYIGTDFMEYKLRHFCYSCDLGTAYESGSVEAQQMYGQEVEVKIGIDDDADYGPKNVVRGYIVKEGNEDRSQAAKVNGASKRAQDPEEFNRAVQEAGEDEIPF